MSNMARQLYDVYTRDREILTLMEMVVAKNAIRKLSVTPVTCLGEFCLRPPGREEPALIPIRPESAVFL